VLVAVAIGATEVALGAVLVAFGQDSLGSMAVGLGLWILGRSLRPQQ
jgi:hypothetical protein